MPPDPTGTLPTRPAVIDLADEGTDEQLDWYDRSSLPGDFMVMIDGQTEDDFWRRSPDHQFREFIDGIVYMPPSVRPGHQFDCQFLLCLVSFFDARRPLGVILTGPAVLKLRDGCLLEPDLFVLPIGARPQVLDERMGRPPALLVVEVLSPSNRSHDLVTKSALYRAADVAEVWYINNHDRVLIVERREALGHVTERFETGVVAPTSLPGFWIDASWLWAEPKPNLLDCLDQILAGPPRG